MDNYHWRFLNPRSLFRRFLLFLNRHILQFTGLEYLSTFLAFHIFGFFIARDNLHSRVLTGFRDSFFLRGLGRLARRHKLAGYFISRKEKYLCPNWRYSAAISRICQVPGSRNLTPSYTLAANGDRNKSNTERSKLTLFSAEATNLAGSSSTQLAAAAKKFSSLHRF